LRLSATLLFRYRCWPARPLAAAAYPCFPAYLFAEPVVAQGLALGQGKADVVYGLVVQLIAEQRPVGALPGCVVLAQFEVEGVRGEAGVALPESVAAVAGPAVVGGVADHVGAHGVEFDIAHAGEKVGFGLDQAGFVSAFPQAAAAAVAFVDVLDVAPADGLHEPGGAFRFVRCDKEVDVVGHEDVGMDGAVPIASRFLQPVEVTVIVLLGEETGLAIDAALHDVLRETG
jgi:hypothetical protein